MLSEGLFEAVVESITVRCFGSCCRVEPILLRNRSANEYQNVVTFYVVEFDTLINSPHWGKYVMKLTLKLKVSGSLGAASQFGAAGSWMSIVGYIYANSISM